MIKVMIVDDEYIVREDLKALIDWEGNGFTIVSEATNGMEAIGLCERYDPQIVIVDVRMPVMNGLEFIEKESKFKSGMKFILLTAYEDFEYARKAIQFGVSSYLLKHQLNSDALLNVLTQIRGHFVKNEQDNRIIKETLLKKLLDGEQNSLNIYKIIKEYRLKIYEGTSILALEIDNYGLIKAGSTPLELVRLTTSILDALKEALSEYQNDVELIHKDENLFIIIFNLVSHSELQRIEHIKELCMKLQSRIETLLSVTVSIGISNPLKRVTDVNTSYIEAINALKHKMFCGKKSVKKYSEIRRDSQISNILVEEKIEKYVNEIKESININDKEKIHALLKKLFMESIKEINDDKILKKTEMQLLEYMNN